MCKLTSKCLSFSNLQIFKFSNYLHLVNEQVHIKVPFIFKFSNLQIFKLSTPGELSKLTSKCLSSSNFQIFKFSNYLHLVNEQVDIKVSFIFKFSNLQIFKLIIVFSPKHIHSQTPCNDGCVPVQRRYFCSFVATDE